MYKKTFLAAAFVGALAFASLGTSSTANAEVCYGRGGGGFYGGPAYGYGGYAPPRRGAYYRGFDRGFSRGYNYGYGGPAYGYGYRAPRRGVSLSFGF